MLICSWAASPLGPSISSSVVSLLVQKRLANLLWVCCVSFFPSSLSRIVKWFWAVSKEKSTCLWRAAATNSLWTCDLEWIMNSVSCTPLFPRKQTLELLKPACKSPAASTATTHFPCCLWSKSAAKTQPRPPFPGPHSRHILVWTGSRYKLADSSKPQRVYYIN